MRPTSSPLLFRAALAICVICLLATIAGGLVTRTRHAEAMQLVQHTSAVKYALATARVHLRDVKIAQLEGHEPGGPLENLEDDVLRIRELTRDNPRQQARIDRLEASIRSGLETSAAATWRDDRTRAILSEIVREEEELMALREVAVGSTGALSLLSVVVTGAITIVMAAVALFLLSLQRRTLERARVEARKASRAKDEFVANMSHEIRTPLTALLGYAQLLQEPSLANRDRLDYARTIQRNGEHLLSLVNDVLDVSKIEAGRMEVAPAPCAPSSILAEVASTLRVRAVERGLAFDVTAHGGIPASVRTDPLRFKQILMNLVGNAIKFTDHGSVRVVARCEGPLAAASLVVEVMDTGIGITDDLKKRLFAPFTQAETSMSRRYEGTGLGLAISRELARLLGGEIAVESVPGKGSTFRLTLPIGSIEDAPWVHDMSLAAEDTLIGRREAIAAIRLSGRVLVADDGADNRRLLAAILGRAGAEVALAEDGRAAVTKALAAERAGAPFHVILMDMQMPEVDGFEATTRLRAAGYAHPIVALTAHVRADYRARCLAAGCNVFATKPIDTPRLLKAITPFLGGSRSEKRLSVRAAPPELADDVFANDPVLRQIAASFVASLPRRAAALEEALAAGDTETVGTMAHALKGEGGSFGYPQLSSIARRIEVALEAGNAPEVAQGVSELSSLCRRAAA
ncbi:MAG TPA: ATP-binding protein [Polyangiaceae bacterium]|jgi:signal transduction histidine kinase/DNA-binding response OmpR family regulator